MFYFSEEIDKALEEQGYEIVCHSPLEVEFVSPEAKQDGVIGTATGVCAKELLNQLVEKLKENKLT